MGYPSLIGGAIGCPGLRIGVYLLGLQEGLGLNRRAFNHPLNLIWSGHRLIQSGAGRFELLFCLDQNSLLTNLAGNFSDERQPNTKGEFIETLGKYLTEARWL